jgi:hypothetical protein
MNDTKSPTERPNDVGPWDNTLADDRPRPSPETDPTNPYREESDGIFKQAERDNEGRSSDPGLTDADRKERAP